MDCRIKYYYAGLPNLSKRYANLGKLLAICVGSLLPAAYGAENALNPDTDAAQPDLEFLEFLGQFETDNGQWIDPDSLLAEEFDDLLNVAENSIQTNVPNNGNAANNATDTDN